MGADGLGSHGRRAHGGGEQFLGGFDLRSAEEQDRLYSALGEGGKATMPLQDTFWGARFGMLTDRFGVNWMFNFDHPRPAL